jgi:hypothetical protein
MKTRKKSVLWRNRLIFAIVVTAVAVGYLIYINSATLYDPAHLLQRLDIQKGAEVFLLSEGSTRVPGMVQAAETEYIALYIHPENTTFAIYDKRNGAVWHSSPQGQETIANPYNRGIMRSNFGFSFYDGMRRRQHRWMYTDSAGYENQQFSFHAITHNGNPGIRIKYIVGNMDIGLHFLPRYLPIERFEEIRAYLATHDPVLAHFFAGQWRESMEREGADPDIIIRPGFMRMNEGIFNHTVNTRRMLDLFDQYFDWEIEQTHHYNGLAGYEPEIDFDYFEAVMDIILDRDRMMVNIPIDGIVAVGETEGALFALDILRFFGAGCRDSEGFMVTGAGGVINFNNGMYREPPFSARVYGDDRIMNSFFPQLEQPMRLPVIGINNNGFGMVAHVVNGQSLASVNAEVAAETIGTGGTTAQNNVWFNFMLRESTELDVTALAPGMPGTGIMTVIQEGTYEGDITIMYHFLPQHNPTVGDMAQAYQGYLVEKGALTPLNGPGERSFYMDIIGAVDVVEHFLGTPYGSLEVMTTMEDANRFVTVLNEGGVNKIQMQLHGWFNRGINHDVANRVNLINRVGTKRELQDMNARLQADGGGLYPVVNFALTNYYSRRFNRALESSRDLAGYIGFMSRIARDMMFTRFSIHSNDWFILVHPGRLPYHVGDFIPSYARNAGIDELALADLGDIVTESLHRRNPINRQSSQLITASQINRLHDAVPNLVIFGGNEYALPFASHIVDAPIETDRFFIIDYEVPFYAMVMHGFVEFAGGPVNMRERYCPVEVLLVSMQTGASPRYVFTALPTRNMQFSPHERFYSTQFANWADIAVRHYSQFNQVHRQLRGERIVNVEVLSTRRENLQGMAGQVTVTVFSNGTRIYVNQQDHDFVHNGIRIPANDFVVWEA